MIADRSKSAMPSTAPRTELFGADLAVLRQYIQNKGEKPFRARQIYHALYAERRWQFERLTNLPLPLRQWLAETAEITPPRVKTAYRSADGTTRYIMVLADGQSAESVFMPETRRQTICISTQAGCPLDCQFCLTATLGLLRNLSPGEILGQVLVALEANRERLRPQTNVVLMGMGEPMLNFENVMAAVRILADPNAVSIPLRKITLSTAGVVPGIRRLAEEPVRPKLAVSLNATTDEVRTRIMPLNKKWPIAELLAACRAYPLRPWERLTFEYVLLKEVNDTPEDARRLVRLISNLRAKVNLIPWNPAPELAFEAPGEERVLAFQEILTSRDIPAFIRRSRGQDIMAACGQLALTTTPSLQSH